MIRGTQQVTTPSWNWSATERFRVVRTVGGNPVKERRTPIKLETATKAFTAHVTNLPAKIERVVSQISGS